MGDDIYVVFQAHDIDSPDEAACMIPPELGVLFAWDQERKAGIALTSGGMPNATRMEELFQLWGWYASVHESATSAILDVSRFSEAYI